MALRYVPRGPARLGMQLVLRLGRNPAPALAQNGPNNLLRQFVSGEEITDLETRGVVGIRTVNGILLDARSPLLADGAFVGLGRIGGAHQFAVVGDGVFFLQRHHDDWAARSEEHTSE